MREGVGGREGRSGYGRRGSGKGEDLSAITNSPAIRHIPMAEYATHASPWRHLQILNPRSVNTTRVGSTEQHTGPL